MNSIQILILAIVQGITEFLPVSSSGHLVVIESLMGATSDVADVNIVLHAGTLISIVVFYWRQIWRLLFADRGVVASLAVGTLPAVIAGLFIKEYVEEWLESPLVAGLMFPITGLGLIWISRREVGQRDYLELSYRDAFLVGLFQALAIAPGISRSGATIFAGLLVGLKRTEAATFSFLLAIPVILGASLLECRDLWREQEVSTSWSTLALGAAVACGVGLLALQWLIRWVARGRLYLFAYWCIPLGVAVLVWQLVLLSR